MKADFEDKKSIYLNIGALSHTSGHQNMFTANKDNGNNTTWSLVSLDSTLGTIILLLHCNISMRPLTKAKAEGEVIIVSSAYIVLSDGIFWVFIPNFYYKQLKKYSLSLSEATTIHFENNYFFKVIDKHNCSQRQSPLLLTDATRPLKSQKQVGMWTHCYF